MPITGTDWEMHIVRKSEQKRGARRRTVGIYKVFHGGGAVAGLSGAVAETRGPGDNSTPRNNRRIEEGRYPLSTQAGTIPARRCRTRTRISSSKASASGQSR